MLPIEWEASYNIGVVEIDRQHQQLVTIINKLSNGILNQSNEDALKAIFNQLIDYTDYHFKSEEKYIKRLTRKDKRLHILQHQNFIEELNRIQQRGINYETAEQVWYFLSDWLISHILCEDIKLFKSNP
ncbi:bacteriohemerythrin [Colwellia sp. MEBiC06753]